MNTSDYKTYNVLTLYNKYFACCRFCFSQVDKEILAFPLLVAATRNPKLNGGKMAITVSPGREKKKQRRQKNEKEKKNRKEKDKKRRRKKKKRREKKNLTDLKTLPVVGLWVGQDQEGCGRGILGLMWAYY